jgi:hypothetical protein
MYGFLLSFSKTAPQKNNHPIVKHYSPNLVTLTGNVSIETSLFMARYEAAVKQCCQISLGATYTKNGKHLLNGLKI